jgi:hypothetical protein
MIHVNEYRANADGLMVQTRAETVRSTRAAEARIRRWCREAGHNPDDLADADTEFGSQWSLDWEDCGVTGSILWEIGLDSLMG